MSPSPLYRQARNREERTAAGAATDLLQRSGIDYDTDVEALFSLLFAGVALYARATGCPPDLTLQAIAENFEADAQARARSTR